jgi:hypothetical protein
MKDALRPFICRPASLRRAAARETLSGVLGDGVLDVFPGLVVALVVRTGDRVDFVAKQSVQEMGGLGTVLPLALENLRRIESPQLEQMRATADRPDSTISIFRTRVEPFCASHILDLDGLIQRTFGITPKRGVLVAIPTWRTIILHLLSGAAVLPALRLMSQVAFGVMDLSPKDARLSSDVYFIAPDRRMQRVAHVSMFKRIALDTRGLFGEVLFGPNGLVASELGGK